MSTIVKYKNQSGTIYAYEQESYYDPVTKSSRPRRKCIGKVDPVTGEIIPSAPKKEKARKNMTSSDDYEALYRKASSELETVKEKLRKSEQENRRYSDLLSSLSAQINKAIDR